MSGTAMSGTVMSGTVMSGTMAAMPMASAGQDCKTCDPQMDMTASCMLSCALSPAGVLPGTVHRLVVFVDCRFDIADVTTGGLRPQPAFTPPRTIILI